MIRFKTIEISNFWSFGKKPTVVELDKNQTTLILGENLDNSDQGNASNGSGKSGIMLAIVYTIYGEGFDKLKQDEFINLTNGKELYCKLVFDKNGTEYTIERGRKPNYLEFYTDEQNLTRDSLKNTQDVIESVIEMDHNIFMNTYYLSPDNTPFLSMKPSEQTSFMERVLSLDVLRNRAEGVKQHKKELSQELKESESLQQQQEQHNQKIDAQIEQTNDKFKQFEVNRENELKEFNKKLEELSQVDVEDNKRKLQAREELLDEMKKVEEKIDSTMQEKKNKDEQYKTLQTQKSKIERLVAEIDENSKKNQEEYDKIINRIKEFNGFDFNKEKEKAEELKDLQKELDDKTYQRDSLKKEMNKVLDEAESKQEEIESLKGGECPYCHQSHYDEDKVSKLENDNNELVLWVDEKEDEYHLLTERIKQLQLDIDSYENVYDINTISNLWNEYDQLVMKKEQIEREMENQEEGKYKLIDEILDAYFNGYEDPEEYMQVVSSEIDNFSKILLDLETERKGFEDSFYSYNIDYDHESLDNIETLKKDLQDDIKRKENEVNPYNEQAEHLQGLRGNVDYQSMIDENRNLMEHADVLVKLLTDNKSFVRKNIVDNYVPYINTQVNKYLNSLNSSHFIEIQSDLSVDIQYMMKSVSYHNCSKGEKLRLNISMSMAFRDMLSMLGHRSNLMLIDEYLDAGGDRSAYTKMFKTLRGYADHVMIVTHRDELHDKVDNVLKVSKQNGFSSVKEE